MNQQPKSAGDFEVNLLMVDGEFLKASQALIDAAIAFNLSPSIETSKAFAEAYDKQQKALTDFAIELVKNGNRDDNAVVLATTIYNDTNNKAIYFNGLLQSVDFKPFDTYSKIPRLTKEISEVLDVDGTAIESSVRQFLNYYYILDDTYKKKFIKSLLPPKSASERIKGLGKKALGGIKRRDVVSVVSVTLASGLGAYIGTKLGNKE